jgi:hypothetical protein
MCFIPDSAPNFCLRADVVIISLVVGRPLQPDASTEKIRRWNSTEIARRLTEKLFHFGEMADCRCNKQKHFLLLLLG